MSTQCKIHCYNSGNNYYVYAKGICRDHITDCPHCDAKISNAMCNKIIDAVLSVDEINKNFVKHHSERNEDLFNISVESVDASIEKAKDL